MLFEIGAKRPRFEIKIKRDFIACVQIKTLTN